jgi:hypothetical protein
MGKKSESDRPPLSWVFNKKTGKLELFDNDDRTYPEDWPDAAEIAEILGRRTRRAKARPKKTKSFKGDLTLNTCEHFWPNFFSVEKCEHEIRSSLFDQNAVRSALTRRHLVMPRKRSAGVPEPVHHVRPDPRGHAAPAPRP